MEKKITLHEFYLIYQNDELDNEIITFNPSLNHFTLSDEKIGFIYDKERDDYLNRKTSFYTLLMNSIVKWFNYDKAENKFIICLKYEEWMKDYDTTIKR